MPAPGDDCGAKDTYVRTNDQAAFNISVKAEGSLQTNGYLILTMGGTTTPDNYTGPSNASIAVFTAADLPTGQAGCLGITTTAMTEPKAGASGVSADGQTLYCAIAGSDPDNSFNNITAPFIYTVTGSAPNGATITPPSISYTSDQQALPLAFNGASNVTDSNPILTVSAAPRWDVAITAPWVGAIFVAKSGPNEEDGYIFSYNIGVKALGSRVGLEALNSAKGLNFSADFGNSANAASPVKNAQLLTWPLDLKANNVIVNMGVDNCVNWFNSQQQNGNLFDNWWVKPMDPGASGYLGNPLQEVGNGGVCASAKVVTGESAGSADFSIVGTDYSLNRFPIQNGGGTIYVSMSNPNSSSNEWWVASKLILVWVPLTDVPADSQTYLLSSTISDISGKSITNQANVQPLESDKTVTEGVRNTSAGNFTKMASTFRYNYYGGNEHAVCDPNNQGDCVVNQVAPRQLFSAYLNVNSIGSTQTLPNAYICDQLDNTRTTFFDATGALYGGYSDPFVSPDLPPPQYYKDSHTGIPYIYLSGNPGTAPITFALGVGSQGASSGTWNTYNTVTSPYAQPAVTGSTNSTGSCTDPSIQWYPSVSALQADNKTLSQVNWVRETFTAGMPANTNVLAFVPLQANEAFTYSTSVNSPGSGAIDAGTSIVKLTNVADTMTVNTAQFNYQTVDDIWYQSRVSDAVQFVQTEYAQLSKSSPNFLNGGQVSAGSTVIYDLQVSLNSTTNTHSTTVTVWDVLPNYMGYVAGSSTFGGAPVADPVCATGSWPSAASGSPSPVGTLESGFTACVWTLNNQTANFSTVFGSAATNIPLLEYRAGVSLTVQNGTSLLNTAFATSTKNLYNVPQYSGGSSGFTCATSAPCYFGNWTLNVSTPKGALLQKSVSASRVGVGTGFSYTLTYGGLGQNLSNTHLIDILPYAFGTSANGTTSSYGGSLALDGPVQAVAGCSSCTPAISGDSDLAVLYTNASPTSISTNGNDQSQDYSGDASGTGTHWCTHDNIGKNIAGCPTSLADVTAVALQPLGGEDLPQNTLYQVSIPVMPTDNAVGNYYVNNFSLASGTITSGALSSNNVTTTVVAPDPAVVKTASPTSIQSGGTVTYTLAVTNATGTYGGPLNAGTITVADSLPDGMTMADKPTATAWDCDASDDRNVKCVYTGELPIGSGQAIGSPIVVQATVSLEAQQKVSSLSNTANLTFSTDGSPASQLSTANDSSTANVAVLPQVTLTKTSNASETSLVTPGGTVTYTVRLRNSGNVAATSQVPFILDDPLPDGVASATWECAASSVNSTCPKDAGSGPLSETVISLQPGDDLTYTVVATLSNSPSSGVITNTATASIPGTDANPLGGNCGPSGTSAPCTASVSNVTAQLGSYKQATSGPINNGDGTFTVGYKVGAMNYTPMDITEFNMTDPLATAAGGAFGTYSSAVLTSAASYTVSVSSCTLLQGSLGASYEPNPAFTGQSVSDTLLKDSTVLPGASASGTPGQVECALTLTFAPTVGQTTYSNQATATGYVLLGELGVLLSDLSNSGADPKGGSPASNPTSEANNVPTIVDIIPSVTPTITKQAEPTTYVVGVETPVVYTITVSNAGNAGAEGFVVTDLSTGNFSITNWRCEVGSAGASYVGVTTACADSGGSGNLNTRANLAPSGSVVYTVQAKINALANTDQTNTATVTPPGSVATTVEFATADATVAPVVQVAPSVSKSASVPTYTQGTSTKLSYTIVARNDGPSGANGFTIVDTPPSGVSIGTWSCAVTTPGSVTTPDVTTACGALEGSGALNTTANLQAGAMITFTVQASIAANATGTLTNAVSITAPKGVAVATEATLIALASVTPAAADISQIPTLRQWALLAISILLACLAVVELRVRRRR